MRDQLLGYLLEALEPAEQAQVEAQLREDPELKRELELISRSLQPLEADRGHFEPPAGLAHRCCEYVALHAHAAVAPLPPAHARSGWTWADMVVAASIFFAATMLFFPALNQSRFAARVTGCQNNLRNIGMALTSYSDFHNGYFPNVPVEGRTAAAGIYAPRLIQHGFLTAPEVLVCPASPLADQVVQFRVPTEQELENAQETQVIQLHRKMGGSYGYNIGYVAGGKYQPTRNLRRVRFAIMADAPSEVAPHHSLNHDGCGQNVLFEDLHVQYLTTCKAHGCNDDIFVNDQGAVAPGLHVHDAVIGSSPACPKLKAVNTIVPAATR